MHFEGKKSDPIVGTVRLLYTCINFRRCGVQWYSVFSVKELVIYTAIEYRNRRPKRRRRIEYFWGKKTLCHASCVKDFWFEGVRLMLYVYSLLLLLFSLSHSLFLFRPNHMVHRIRATECQRLLMLPPSHPTRSQYQPWPAGREIDVIARSKHILSDPT